MTVVYVREQGAMVRKDNQQLKVMLAKRELLKIPIGDLERLVLMGNVQITTQAVAFLVREGIPVVLMTANGGHVVDIAQEGSRQALLRHLQLRLCDDEARSLAIAREIVLGKINNQRVLLQHRGDRHAGVMASVQGMAQMFQSAEQTNDIEQLRGYEGKAAAYYFEAVKAFFHPDWGFRARQYYPPPDPANALLSLAYTLLLKDVEAKIRWVGLDPYLGFFHALGYDRPGLALDVMEEFRPAVADVVVLGLVDGGYLTLDDFEWTNKAEMPVRMSKQAVKVLVEAYESRMAEKIYHPLANGQTDYRRAIELQVRQVAHIVRGDQDTYHPLVMR